MKRWFFGDRAPRYPGSGLVAAYWSPGTPQLYPLKDISLTGAYLQGSVDWPLGTSIIAVIRQAGPALGRMIEVPALSIAFRVVRYGPDGIGVSFAPHTRQEQDALRHLIKQVAASSR